MSEYNQQQTQQIQEIIERNRRVEADKAWETSWFRIGLVGGIIYFVTVAVMWNAAIERFWMNALIPVVGYILSTLSLPPVKRWWIRQRYKK